MFENIIGQELVISTLRNQIRDNCFPQAVLFYGPRYSGKLSTALEIARALTCEERRANWECDCNSCHLHRLLVNPLLIIAGPRYFELEIASSADVLKRVKRRGTRFLFVRAIRRLLRRFDPLLWRGEEESISRWQKIISEIEEHLELIEPGHEDLDKDKMDKCIDKIVKLSLPLATVANKRTISINQIRSISAWTNIIKGDERKIVIIENADRMQDSAMNSTLKMLEEPPEGVYFILITTRKTALYSTILSRLRKYYFPRRSVEKESYVLKRIFHENPEDFLSLEDYFERWGDVRMESIRKEVKIFLEKLFSGVEVTEVLNGTILKERTYTLSFLRELLGVLRMIYLREISDRKKEIGLSITNMEKVLNLVNRSYYELDTLNIKPALVIENMYMRLKGQLL